MASLGDEEESQPASSDNENDQDETMDDADDGDADPDQDANGDADNDMDDGDDNEDNNDDDEDGDDNTEAFDESPLKGRPRPPVRSTSDQQPDPDRDEDSNDTQEQPRRTSNTNDDRTRDYKTPDRAPPSVQSTPSSKPFKGVVRPDAITANLYDIVPTIAAPHSTSINAITATPDMRWVFSGGSDGWIRKFNWVDTVNSKAMLTVAQRHPFVDSVVKAGVLMSYWENEEPSEKTETETTQAPDEALPLSPVYSLAVHPQALWLLSGTEIGAINLQSVRHQESKRITSLFHHTSAVSVMQLLKDNRSLLSGSWDKTILEWDLNVGQVKRSFLGSRGQISALEVRPSSTTPVPRDTYDLPITNGANAPAADQRPRNSVSEAAKAAEKPPESAKSPGDSLFGGNADNDSLFGDNDDGAGGGMNFDDDDEFSKAIANGIQQNDQLDAEGDFPMSGSPTGLNAREQDSTGALDTENNQMVSQNEEAVPNGSPRAEDLETVKEDGTSGPAAPVELEQSSESTFLDAAHDGTLRVWDRRQQNPVARMLPGKGIPPWCMHACWSPDGNFIYAGRRNGTVDEYSIHKGLRDPTRSLKFPGGSGAVTAVRAMPNSKHLVCASYDILRLYDLKDVEYQKHGIVPFLIVPGHRTGVVSQLYIDDTCTFMISTGGNRGWEGASTEVLLGYEIGVGR